MKTTAELKMDVYDKVMKLSKATGNTELGLAILDNSNIQRIFIEQGLDSIKVAFGANLTPYDLITICDSLKNGVKLKELISYYSEYSHIVDGHVNFMKRVFPIVELFKRKFKRLPDEELVRMVIHSSVDECVLEFVFDACVRMKKKLG